MLISRCISRVLVKIERDEPREYTVAKMRHRLIPDFAKSQMEFLPVGSEDALSLAE